MMDSDRIEAVKTLVAVHLERDRDPQSLEEIKGLAAAGEWAHLQDRLGSRLEFGTAGLRGPIGGGINRMSCLTVIQTTQGLYAHLALTLGTEALATQGIVVGCDHRHRSRDFAALTAAVFLFKGVRVYWFPNKTIHTPLVPYTVTLKGAAAGVMITASHNPKTDNGYKLYGQNGCQIISPQDKEIASCIECVIYLRLLVKHRLKTRPSSCVHRKSLEPWTWDLNLISQSPLSFDASRCIDEYFDNISSLAMHR
jgi:phosphoglucomutase